MYLLVVFNLSVCYHLFYPIFPLSLTLEVCEIYTVRGEATSTFCFNFQTTMSFPTVMRHTKLQFYKLISALVIALYKFLFNGIIRTRQ